ncbi:MAG: hypothetical protein JRJ85_07215 [Deltaproteobacteria bacterium]|nr:hypothetical protein [Deltaproteobacteria bacterium]
MSRFGYTGRILKIDLSCKRSEDIPTAVYAERFIGGRGIAARIYWDSVPPRVRAFDPENHLIYMTGPVTGFPGVASSRWQICGKSPAMDPESFSYANLGGSWGVWLKYAGCDGLIVHGTSDKPVYLFIHNGHTEIRDAVHLWGKTAIEVCDELKAELGKKVKVMAIGPAGENRVSFATMLADDGSSGSSGFGAVMGSKRLKAIAVSGEQKPRAADPDRLRSLAEHANRLKKDSWGGYNPPTSAQLKPLPCYGCNGCFRQSYKAEKGKRFKYFCQAGSIYRGFAVNYYDGMNDVPLLAIRLCDRYGLDTAVMQPMIGWLMACHEEGVLREAETGLSLSKIGSAEFIEALVHKISFREGFGDLLAQGTIKTAKSVGKEAEKFLEKTIMTPANEQKDYDPRLMITNALLYATEPRRPIQQLHEVGHTLIKWLEWHRGEKGAYLSWDLLKNIAETFWGSTAAADLSTYEGKALAAKTIQDRTYAKECLILCDIFWPIKWVKYSDDHTGDPTLESQVFSAVTGLEVDDEALNRLGEKIFNLQRAILLRQGWGGREGDRLFDDLHEQPFQTVFYDPEGIVPGPEGKPVSRQGEVVDKKKFEKMKSEYYNLRGWDAESGLPTWKMLEELELRDIAEELHERDLIG